MAMFMNAQDDTATSDKLTFEKGSHFVNANVALRHTNSDFEIPTQTQESKNFGFSINSSYAYAISDNLFLGIGLGYSSNSSESGFNDTTDSELSNNAFEVFPYVRYYKGIGKKLALFIQGETRYTNSNSEVDNEDTRGVNSFFFGVRPGLTFMLNKNLALETSIGALGYTTGSVDYKRNDSESNFNRFDISLNSSNLFFGLSYYF